jgi:hypothetical protein
MLLFRSEEEIDRWCAEHGRERGAAVPVGRLAALAAEWYGGRLDAAWRPRSRDESQAVLAAHGLTGRFWQLP